MYLHDPSCQAQETQKGLSLDIENCVTCSRIAFCRNDTIVINRINFYK